MNAPAPLSPCVAIMGPTAAGKTAAALAIAAALPVEIISVDSAQIYRHMNIGTAKPEAEVLARIPHHLIDIREPTQAYSAAEFRDDAFTLIEDIRQRGCIPLLVGGTMLYFRSLFGGLSALPAADTALRRRLDAEAAAVGWEALHRRLAAVDPESAARIHPNDPQRIQRALEVYEISGRSLSEWFKRKPREPEPRAVLKLAVAPGQRSVLHERIARRFEHMLAQGLVEEVRALRRRYDLRADLPAMRAVGYRQVWDYLEGLYDVVEMRARGIAATRQLAKRQYTWLRREPGVVWYDLNHREMTQNIMIAVRRFAERHQLMTA